MSVDIKTVVVSPKKNAKLADTNASDVHKPIIRSPYLGDRAKLQVGAMLMASAVALVLYEKIIDEQDFTPFILIIAMMMLSAGMTLVLTTFIESKVSSDFKVKFFGNEVPIAARGETMVMILLAVGLMILLGVTGGLENDLKEKRLEAEQERDEILVKLADTEGILEVTEGHRTIYENVMTGKRMKGEIRILRFGVECSGKGENVRLYDWKQRDGTRILDAQKTPLPVGEESTEYLLVKDADANQFASATLEWDSANGVIHILLTVDDTAELTSFCGKSKTHEDAGTEHDPQRDDELANLTQKADE